MPACLEGVNALARHLDSAISHLPCQFSVPRVSSWQVLGFCGFCPLPCDFMISCPSWLST